jgi:HEAT repeat protein
MPDRLQNLRTLRYANLDMAFSTGFVTLTTGTFLVGFIQLLGGSDLWIGVLSAIPALTGLFQVPGAIWGRSFASYKRFVTPGGFLWRALHVPIVVLPLIALANDLRLLIMAFLVMVASICVSIVNPIYSDWLAEMIPSNARGWYFSRRNAIGAVAGALAGILGAVYLDWMRGRDLAPQGFAGVFALGLLCALISMYFYNRMQDLPRERPVRQNVREGIRAIGTPFGDPAYRRVLVFIAFAILGQTFPGNLYSAFGRESLKLDFVILQGTAVFMAVGNVAAAPLWGYLADKFGNKPILALGLLLLATNPLPWIACVPGATAYNAAILLSSHVAMGVIWSMVALTQFNIMLATANPNDRANYIGAGMTVTAVTGGVAPLLGAAVMAGLRGAMSADMAYKTIFGITVGLRVLSALMLFPVREAGAAGFRATVRELRNVTPGRWKAARSVASGQTGAERQRAMSQVGRRGISLAADDVIKALHDPLPTIRRQAATTLADLRDPRAVDELLHQIAEHPALVEEEMIDALGRLGDVRAVPALLELLHAPRSLIRRAAARALGRLGCTDPGLIDAALQREDPDLRRAALQALRVAPERADNLRRDVGTAIRDAVLDPHPSVRIAAAEAAVEWNLSEAAPEVRLALQRYSDEACAELAYALGAIGGPSDSALIAVEIERSVSQITRRRGLLGLGRLYGVEDELYRMMLLDDIPRDRRVEELVRRIPGAHAALRAYSRGEDAAATEALITANAGLADLPVLNVPESFYLSALVAKLRATTLR